MKTFFSLLLADLRRAFCSRRFVFSVLGVTLAMLLVSFGLMSSTSDALYLMGLSSHSETMALILGILPILPFAVTFASEWEENSARFWLIRGGADEYAVCKIIASAVSGFLTTAAGMAVFILLMRLKYPLFTHANSGDPYALALLAGSSPMPVRYLAYYICHISLSAALFAVTALWVSTYLPNRFATVAAPLVIYFILFRLTTMLPIPDYLKISVVVQGGYPAGSPRATLLVKLLTVCILCVLMGFGTVRQIRRRMQNE